MPRGSTSPPITWSRTARVRLLGGDVEDHALDRALGGAHAVQDLSSLERRARGRRGGDDAVVVADDDLAVRADVDQQPRRVSRAIPVATHVGHDVGPHVRADRREQHEPPLGWIAIPASAARRSCGSRNVAMNGERPIDSGSTPSSRCSIVALPAATTSSTSSRAIARGRAHAAEQPVDRADDRGPQLLERLGTVHLRVAHPGQHVGAERRLAVDRGLHRGRRLPRAGPSGSRRTVVVPTSIETPKSRSVVSPGSTSTSRSPITVAVTVDVSSSSIAAARRGSTARRVRDLEPFVDERVGDAAQAAAGILERRGLRASARTSPRSAPAGRTAPPPSSPPSAPSSTRGTSTTMSSPTSHWHDRRHPSSSPSETWR